MEQIAEEKGSMTGLFVKSRAVSIESSPPFGFLSRHIGPADLLGIGQETGLDGLMLARRGHRS
jgi:hypothetical protein